MTNSAPVPVLFLDFDGVCRPADDPVLDAQGQLLDGASRFPWLPVLACVIRESNTRPRIVVSSDWCRLVDDAGLCALLGPIGDCFMAALEPPRGLSRAQAIERWAVQKTLVRWLALDDDVSVKVAARRNSKFVWCHPQKGVTEPRVCDRVRAFLQA